VHARTRVLLLAGAALVAGVLVLTTALWPVLDPLTQRTPLPAEARSTHAGVPVPASAERCAFQDRTVAGSVRWCMPSGVSVATLGQWYDDALPPGRNAGDLRWCVETRQSDGSRRALWSTSEGLVGYVLPADPPRIAADPIHDAVAVQVVVLSGSGCPAVARTSREDR
jgi:hypothetical protein